MKKVNRLSRMRRVRFGPWFFGVLLMTSCSDRLRWTEDIRLPDGRVITLKREAEFAGGGGHIGDPSTESYQSFEFRHPDTREVVRWENKLVRSPLTLSRSSPVPRRFDTGPDGIAAGRLNTVALWLQSGKPLMLGTPSYGDDFARFHCPSPPYLLFEYSAGRWKSKPLQAIAIPRIRANLTVSAINARETIETSNHHLSVEQTENSFVYRAGFGQVPFILNFDRMPEQKFDFQACSQIRNE